MSDWQSDLDAFLATKEQEQQEQDRNLEANKALVTRFIEGKVLPALEEVKAALEGHGRRVSIVKTDQRPVESHVTISVVRDGISELDCLIKVEAATGRSFPLWVNATRWSGRPKVGLSGRQRFGVFRDADASKLTQTDIRQSVLDAYKKTRDEMRR